MTTLRELTTDFVNNFTEVQRRLHLPDASEKKVGSVFKMPFHKGTWYYPMSQVLKREIIEGPQGMDQDTIIFTADTTKDTLQYVDLALTLPPIQTREGYEARYIHNVGVNMIKTATLVFNDVNLGTFDAITLEQYFNTELTADQLQDLDRDLGNVPILQEWASFLPSYYLSLPVPFEVYTKGGFILAAGGGLDRLEHRFTLRSNLADLIQVRRKDGELVKADATSIAKIGELEVKDRLPSLPPPDLWGLYTIQHDIESTFSRCHPRVMIVEDTLMLESDREVGLGETYTFNVSGFEYPVVEYMWVAQNQTAVRHNQYSNYTSCATDHQEGWSVCAEASLTVNGCKIFERYPYQRTERINTRHNHRSAPRGNGFNYWRSSVSSRKDLPTPSSAVRHFTLKIKLADTNPYLGKESTPKTSEDRFILHLRVKYLKEVTLTLPSTPTERDRQLTRVEVRGKLMSTESKASSVISEKKES